MVQETQSGTLRLELRLHQELGSQWLSPDPCQVISQSYVICCGPRWSLTSGVHLVGRVRSFWSYYRIRNTSRFSAHKNCLLLFRSPRSPNNTTPYATSASRAHFYISAHSIFCGELIQSGEKSLYIFVHCSIVLISTFLCKFHSLNSASPTLLSTTIASISTDRQTQTLLARSKAVEDVDQCNYIMVSAPQQSSLPSHGQRVLRPWSGA